jgi:hypothetical protein
MKTFKNILRVIGLGLCLAIAAMVAGGLAGVNGFFPAPADPALAAARQSASLAGLLACALVYAVLLVWLGRRSVLHGWRLSLVVFLVYFGMKTFMSQIESAIFLPRILPPGALGAIVLAGAIEALLAAILAPLFCGRLRRPAAAGSAGRDSAGPVSGGLLPSGGADAVFPRLGRGELAVRLSLIAVLYYALYWSFGFFIAWQNPELRAYYAPMHLENFWWMPGFQWLRGLAWTGLCLLIARSVTGRLTSRALLAGLCMSLLMNACLLVPFNPIMPDSIRLTHFVETASSNLIFGFLAVWLMGRPAWGRQASAVAADAA